MKIGNVKQLNDFELVVNECVGQVWLESPEGDRFNLKSVFSKYISYGRLLSECGDYLELFCSDKDDEQRFFKYFERHPDVIHNQ